MLHTVFISYHRPELTERAIYSYVETVTLPHTIMVVDNGSERPVEDMLATLHNDGVIDSLMLLGENRYPGFACNRGFELAPPDAVLLHRADNDFEFLPGWCEQVTMEFVSPRLGQLGLRTDEEECNSPINVGGNMVLRRELWDNGLRYDERPWPEYPTGWSEDGFMSPQVRAMGWNWRRVRRPCIRALADGDWSDEYYIKSYGDRGLFSPEDLIPAEPEES